MGEEGEEDKSNEKGRRRMEGELRRGGRKEGESYVIGGKEVVEGGKRNW